jgi:hypothetical protein
VQVPQIRGREEPYRSQRWGQGAQPREVRKRLSVERYAGGLSQRDMEDSLEKALGQFVLSKRAVSELTDSLRQADEAFRTRELSGGMRWPPSLWTRAMSRCDGGGASRGCFVAGRFAWLGARCCSVSPRPLARALRVVGRCCGTWSNGGCRRP